MTRRIPKLNRKEKENNMKRFLAVLLCVLMVAAMFTITASADEGDGTVAVG